MSAARASRVLTVAISLVPLTPLPAQAWLRAVDHPAGRTAAALAYDSVRERLLLCGGVASVVELADAWERVGNRWAAGPSGLPPRAAHAMAFDAARQRMVVFGGMTFAAGTNSDTWEFNGDLWQRRFPSTSPAARSGHAMVYDDARNRVVMFGGRNGKGWLDDTWEYDGSDWRRNAVAAPSARSGHVMVYDSTNRRTLLFAGQTPLPSNDLWSYDGVSWTQLTTSVSPPARSFCAASFDTVRRRLLVFGGEGSSGAMNDTWEFNGTTWSPVIVNSPPPPLDWPSMAFDVAAARSVLFGVTPDATTEVGSWTFDGSNWSTNLEPPQPPGTLDASAVATDRARNRVVALLRSSNSRLRHMEWDGAVWRELAIALPNVRHDHALAYDETRRRIVLFGGTDGAALLSDTWEFDGVTWALISTPVARPARAGHALTYDPARRRTVLFGGGTSATNYLADTWEWDGASWVQRVTTVAPSPRSDHALAFLPGLNVLVLHGGQVGLGTAAADTWQWDGTAWTRLADAGVARSGHAMVYDQSLGALLVAGGSGEQRALQFDGTRWLSAPLGNTVDRVLLALDPVRRRTLLVGAVRDSAHAQTTTWHAGQLFALAFANGGCQATSVSLRIPASPRIGSSVELSVWDRPPQALRANAPVVWLLGNPANIAVGPCTLAVAPATAVTLIGRTNTSAFASVALPVPLLPSAVGSRLTSQAAILDPASPLGVTLSGGVQMTIGG